MTDDPPIIAYVVTHHPRTTHTFVTSEIAGLRAAGFGVVVFALNAPTPDQVLSDAARAERQSTIYLKERGAGAVLRSAIRALRLDPIGFARTFMLALSSGGTDLRRLLWRVFHFAEALVVWDECRQRGVDTIHAQFGQTPSTVAWLAVELARNLGAGCDDWVFTVHGVSEIEDRAESMIARKVPSSRAMIAVSEYTRSQALRQLEPRLWEKVHVVHCGVDLEHFPHRGEHSPGEPPLIVFVGRAVPAKGLPVLLAAAHHLADQGLAFRLVIVGGGSFEPELRAAVAGGADWLELTGEQPPGEVAKWLSRADVFCLPSLDEGLPVSVMEAMAVGVPVVTTAVAGIPELAVDGSTALVVPPGNVIRLAGALERLVTDPALGERLSVAARERVVAHHDERACLDELVQVISPTTVG